MNKKLIKIKNHLLNKKYKINTKIKKKLTINKMQL